MQISFIGSNFDGIEKKTPFNVTHLYKVSQLTVYYYNHEVASYGSLHTNNWTPVHVGTDVNISHQNSQIVKNLPFIQIIYFFIGCCFNVKYKCLNSYYSQQSRRSTVDVILNSLVESIKKSSTQSRQGL